MKNSDLVQILQSFSVAERRSLRKFVTSPWANQRADVVALFNYLEAGIYSQTAALTREQAHGVVYPGQPFNDKQMRRLMSYLLKVVENYLTMQERLADKCQNDIALAAAYRKLGLEKHARQSMQATEIAQASRSLQDVSFFETQYQLEVEALALAERTSRTAPRNLQSLNFSLDMSYLSNKLRQSCTALSHQAVTNTAYDLGLLNLVLGYLENNALLEEYPVIGLYFNAYRAATTGEERYFHALKSGIFTMKNTLPPEEIRNVYLLAINYCIRQINGGASKFNTDLFELYTSALEGDILLENGQLSRFAFKNIAALALRLGELEWTAAFIEKFGPAVDYRHRRNYTDFNLAKLFYAKGDFDKAMRLLHKVEYEDVFLNLDAKILLLKIYFEQGETEALDSFIQSFQRFLQRKSKELGYHRENYLNTLNFTSKLLTINPLDKMEKERLRSEVIGAKALGEREWLLERLSQ